MLAQLRDGTVVPASDDVLDAYLDNVLDALWPLMAATVEQIPAPLHDALRWQDTPNGLFAFVNPARN